MNTDELAMSSVQSPSETDALLPTPNRPGLFLKTSLYREFMAQRDEILKHKWIESEKAGHDIGFERALVNWLMNHRANWRRQRKALYRLQAEMASGREGALN